MSKNWSYALFSSLLLTFFLILDWLILPYFLPAFKPPVVPLPNFLSRLTNNQVKTLELWFPQTQVLGASIAVPQLTGTAAVSYDLSDNKLIFAKNPDAQLPFASLTKIMTAIVALEYYKSDQELTVPASALVGEDSMGLDSGEALTTEELLYGMILHSGNDAAEVYAANYPGGRDAFIKAMNQKAEALGLTHTHFTNPTGLQGDGYQHTTAYDLLIMTKYALENFPIFAKVAASISIDLPQTSTHKQYYLENETNLLTTYPGVKGIKTGFTPEAGLCLITYLEYKNHKIIAVLLGSQNRRDEMKEILDYSLNVQGIIPPRYTGG